MTSIKIVSDVNVEPTHFFGCIGYENRSLHYLRNKVHNSKCKKLCFDYKSVDVHSYNSNLAEAQDIADKIYSEFEVYLDHMRTVILTGERVILQIDITSLDRGKIAEVLVVLFESSAADFLTSIVYCPAKYVDPILTLDVVNSFGPVSPVFMGNSALFRDKLTLIVGAGFEYGRVVGAIDSLEPDRVHCFSPTGSDPRFENTITKANLSFNFLESKDSLTSYDIKDPFALYYNLRRIVEFELSSSSVLIVPLGPKIFAAFSMLIALILHPNVSVWRHSTATIRRPDSVSDSHSSGEVIEFCFQFS